MKDHFARLEEAIAHIKVLLAINEEQQSLLQKTCAERNELLRERHLARTAARECHYYLNKTFVYEALEQKYPWLSDEPADPHE